MDITFACPGCRKNYTLSATLAGKKARCKQCGQQMEIPVPMAVPAPESPVLPDFSFDSSSMAAWKASHPAAAAEPPKRAEAPEVASTPRRGSVEHPLESGDIRASRLALANPPVGAEPIARVPIPPLVLVGLIGGLGGSLLAIVVRFCLSLAR